MDEKSYLNKGDSLKMPRLKTTDYYLFTQEKQYFSMGMRELVVLGLRWIYAGWHREDMRAMILALAEEIKMEDLDKVDKYTEYTPFKDIADSQVQRP